MKRLIQTKENQLSFCTQILSVGTPHNSFVPLFSVKKTDTNEIKLELTPLAASSYNIPEGSDIDKASSLVSALTRSSQNEVTHMHQVLYLFAAGKKMQNGMLMFERDGSYSVSEQATKSSSPTLK